MKPLILVASIVTALSGVISTAQAETIFGLTTINSIFSFDSATPLLPSTVIPITGVTIGQTITDIDFSPVSGALYGIATNGDLYRVNTTTGAATLTLGVGSQIAPNTITAPTAIDFNPAADRIRVFQGTSNFRLTGDVTTFDSVQTVGTVSTDGPFSGVAGANLVAAAYTNNFNGTATTALFSLDTVSDTLISHTGAPQFSTISTVGALGVNIGTNVGFDISGLQGSTTGYVSDGNNFYTINLGTGALTSVGLIAIGGALTTKSIAASTVPEPTVMALGAVGLIGLLARRRRNA